MHASTGMYSLGAGVLIVGAIMGVRYTGGLAPASAAAAPAPAPAAAPAFANLAPAAAVPSTSAADPDKPRYFGPDGMSLLIAGPGGPESAAHPPRPPQHRAALNAAADEHR